MFRTLSIATIVAAIFSLPAIAQTSTVQPVTPSAPVTSSVTVPLMLSAEQAKSWIDKPVYSSDNKQIGEVAAFVRGADNTVTEMHADIGGFLGFGKTRIKLTPAQFKLQGDRVVLSLTADQSKNLPTITK